MRYVVQAVRRMNDLGGTLRILMLKRFCCAKDLPRCLGNSIAFGVALRPASPEPAQVEDSKTALFN